MILFRLILESFQFALSALVVNKVRTVLSLLGITIGIFSIIAVFSVFDSLEKAIRSDISSLGDNVLFIQKWPWMMGGSDYPWWKYWQRPEASLRELAELQKRSNAAEAFAYQVTVTRNLSYRSTTIEQTMINAVSHDYDRVMPMDIEQGRYFTPLESQTGRNVIIIGADVAETLFLNSDPIGRSVKVFGLRMDVIGVMAKSGDNIFGGSNDNAAFITVNFARNVIDLRNTGSSIMARTKAGLSNEELKDELTGIMRSVRKLKPAAEDNFAINEMDIINRGFDQLFGVIAIVGWIIGGFSLLVGGFGIANIMFVSVKERTNQIGIQKSLGAKNYFVLLQFLFEAIFLSVLGGIVGLVIVFLLAVAISSTTSFVMSLSLGNIVLGLVVSGFIGLFSGFIPAWSASRLDPVEAMRSNF
ncbi:MAG: ABC transporter permease [Bacteroidetes bacterium]|nr:ABC transporter permease [Bacteroidota bacterium]MBU1578863.1 ABC transporter permease [Bacteroidota bacterium]MBU2558714.1 ABC transporter permease [Bacteroidota bacterium]